MKIKIANIVNELDKGGAAIAVERLNKVLNKYHTSEIITFVETGLYFKFFNKVRYLINKLIKKIFLNNFQKINGNTINLNIFNSKLLPKINTSNNDIINLHWIGNDTLSLDDIKNIKKKVIFTLHDMWPYTSIEHYMDEEIFIQNYTIDSKNIKNKIVRKIFEKKIDSFKNIQAIICTSNWQKKMADKSLVLNNLKKFVIPLPIDFEYWKPVDYNYARKELNISKDQYVLFLPLSNIYAYKRKGLDILISSLEKINNINILLITTNFKDINFHNQNIKHFNLKNFKSNEKLKKIYSASDLFLMPSRYESFGQTLLESLACNCPGVVFKNTGCEDMIKHGLNGYKANYLDIDDLKNGIIWSLKNLKRNNSIRKYAMTKYSEDVVAEMYNDVIKDII